MLSSIHRTRGWKGSIADLDVVKMRTSQTASLFFDVTNHNSAVATDNVVIAKAEITSVYILVLYFSSVSVAFFSKRKNYLLYKSHVFKTR